MLADETCWFLAVDFDKKSWMQDVAAFRDTTRAKGVPVAIERSRSGNGAHAWIFFAEPVPAAAVQTPRCAPGYGDFRQRSARDRKFADSSLERGVTSELVSGLKIPC